MWNCATEECGVQCVMTHGMMMMQLWCADSWDTVQQVCSVPGAHEPLKAAKER